MLRGRPGVSMLDDLLKLDDLLMMDNLFGVGQHLGRNRDDSILVVSYMIWMTTQGREILVSHPFQNSLLLCEDEIGWMWRLEESSGVIVTI